MHVLRNNGDEEGDARLEMLIEGCKKKEQTEGDVGAKKIELYRSSEN
jgi:hypothetical protein